MSTKPRQRRVGLVKGLATLAAFATAVSLSLASYRQVFTDRTEVSVEAGRAGLLLEPGADVTLRDITIGEVLDVDHDGDRVLLRLGLDTDDAELVPAEVEARVVSPSLLGPKYVSLVPGPGGAGPTVGLSDGDVIAAVDPQLEVNAAFDDLVTLLEQVKPFQLNQALGALAGTLRDRGERLGQYLDAADAYLQVFNEHLGALEIDLRTGAEVARVYQAIAPQLLQIISATTTTGRSIVEESRALDGLLTSLYDTSEDTRRFLAENRMPLRDALELLRTTTGTLARFAPMFPCLFRSIDDFRRAAEPASGGRYPGLWTHISILPGAMGYRAPENLPRVVADSPDCSGGPIGSTGPTYRPRRYGDGSPDPYQPFVPVGQSLVDALFGSAGRP